MDDSDNDGDCETTICSTRILQSEISRCGIECLLSNQIYNQTWLNNSDYEIIDGDANYWKDVHKKLIMEMNNMDVEHDVFWIEMINVQKNGFLETCMMIFMEFVY
jgi:hypothetical protein